MIARLSSNSATNFDRYALVSFATPFQKFALEHAPSRLAYDYLSFTILNAGRSLVRQSTHVRARGLDHLSPTLAAGNEREMAGVLHAHRRFGAKPGRASGADGRFHGVGHKEGCKKG